MQTLSIAQFEELLKSESWTHSQYNHIERTLEEGQFFGFAQVELTLDELTIKYTELFSFNAQSKELNCETSDDGDVFELDGFEVINEDGEQLNDYELYDLLYQKFCVDQDVLLNEINEEIAA